MKQRLVHKAHRGAMKPQAHASTAGFVKAKRGRPRNLERSPEYEHKLSAIIESAANVFREKGYASGSLDDVAAALGIRKATLYYYVASKAALLELIFERALDLSRKKIDTLQRISDPGERLRALIRHQIQVVTSDPGHFTVFFDHLTVAGQAPKKSTHLRAFERAYVDSFLRIVEGAIEVGVIADVSPRYAAQAIIGMTCWTYKWFDPSRHDLEAMVDTCVGLLLQQRSSQRNKQ